RRPPVLPIEKCLEPRLHARWQAKAREVTGHPDFDGKCSGHRRVSSGSFELATDILFYHKSDASAMPVWGPGRFANRLTRHLRRERRRPASSCRIDTLA